MRILSSLVIALFAVIASFALTGYAHAATLSHPSPTHTACVAFQRWNHHRSAHNLNAMYRARVHASSTVRTDIEVVYTEVKQNDWFDLPADVHFTALDCKGK